LQRKQSAVFVVGMRDDVHEPRSCFQLAQQLIERGAAGVLLKRRAHEVNGRRFKCVALRLQDSLFLLRSRGRRLCSERGGQQGESKRSRQMAKGFVREH
jgi:hypothetical protein